VALSFIVEDEHAYQVAEASNDDLHCSKFQKPYFPWDRAGRQPNAD
jgi:hypothetical protein